MLFQCPLSSHCNSLYVDANFISSLVCGVQHILIVSWVAIASVPSLKVRRTGIFLVLPVTVRLVLQLMCLMLKWGSQLDLSRFVSSEPGNDVQSSFQEKKDFVCVFSMGTVG